MKSLCFLLLLLLASLGNASGQLVSGTVVSGELSVPFASLVKTDGQSGTIADENGNFTLATPGTCTISAIGYQTLRVYIDSLANQRISLQPAQYLLDEFAVTASRQRPNKLLKRARRKFKSQYSYSYKAHSSLSIRDSENSKYVRAVDCNPDLCGTGKPKPHIKTDVAYASKDYSQSEQRGLNYTTWLFYFGTQIKNMVPRNYSSKTVIEGTDTINGQQVTIVTYPISRKNYVRVHISNKDYAVLRAEHSVNIEEYRKLKGMDTEKASKGFDFHDIRVADYEKIGSKYYLTKASITVFWNFDMNKDEKTDIRYERKMSSDITITDTLPCTISEDERYTTSTRFFWRYMEQIGDKRSWEEWAKKNSSPEHEQILKDFASNGKRPRRKGKAQK